MSTHPYQRNLDNIANSNDAVKLRQIAKNARQQGNGEVEKAASLRLYAIMPSEEPGTLEHDIWQSIFALEHSLTNERGRTTRLQRTRNKIKEVGELGTVSELLLKSKASDGFHMLIERGMPERTFEAVALRHAAAFDEAVLIAAKARLDSVGEF